MTKVLLVEDEDALRETLEEILELNDIQVSSVASGEDALVILNTWTPDLIISDIMMPGISGIDLVKILKSNTELKDVPVIFLSALASEDDQNRGLVAGANGYVTKPFKSVELISLIKKLIK